MTDVQRACRECGQNLADGIPDGDLCGKACEDTARLLPHELLVRITEAARLHGEADDSDHEVGDLQEALTAAWGALSREAQRSVYWKLHAEKFEWFEETW